MFYWKGINPTYSASEIALPLTLSWFETKADNLKKTFKVAFWVEDILYLEIGDCSEEKTNTIF